MGKFVSQTEKGVLNPSIVNANIQNTHNTQDLWRFILRKD